MLDDPIKGGGGDPLTVARELLQDRKRIWIATDIQGFTTFKNARFPHFEFVRHVTGIEVLEVGEN
jgi:hypothetical protein